MSALQVKKMNCGNSNQHMCENNYMSGHRGTKHATFRVSICGWPVGEFCPACAKNLEAIWAKALVR